jgi:GcrA cell cycle regulator
MTSTGSRTSGNASSNIFGSPTWTDERDKELEELIAAGLSSSEIGSRLGVTRNAVIGRIHRRNLRLHRSPLLGAKKLRAPRAPRARKIGHPAPKQNIDYYKTSQEFDAAIPVKQRKQLVDLTSVDCRWPCGNPGHPDFFFCGGGARTDSPYCDFHHSKAFNGIPQRRRIEARPR